MYKVFRIDSMDILGNGAGSLKTILGTTGGGGGGGASMKGVKTVFTFKANDTELKNDLNLVDGELLLRDPEQGDVRFSNGNDTVTRGMVAFSDTLGQIRYNTDQFHLRSSENEKVLVGDRAGRIGIHKVPDTSYNVDVSGSVNVTGTLYRNGYDILFNLGKLFDYLTKPAPAFDKNDRIADKYGGTLSIQRTSFNITLFWKKGEAYDTSYNFALETKELPYINQIGIDILDASGRLTNWVNVTSSIHGYDLSYVFDIDSQFTDSQGNTFTADKESVFALRVYPINSTNELGDPYNYLVFEDLSFVAPSAPTVPRNLSVQLVGDRQRTYRIDFIKPEYNDSVIGPGENVFDNPPIVRYRIQYQPQTQDCLKFPSVYDTEQITIERNGTNATTTYTVTDDGTTDIERVYPGTMYDISLSAKNEQEDRFGTSSNVSIQTNLPDANDFVNVQLTNIDYLGKRSQNLPVYIPNGGNQTIQYFNLHESYKQLSANTDINTVFVNFHRLGISSDNRQGNAQNLARVIAYHKVAGVESEDSRIEFDGYEEDAFVPGEGYHGALRVIYPNNNPRGVEWVNELNLDANTYKDDRPEYYGFGLRGQYQLVLTNLIGTTIGNGNTRFEPSVDQYEIGYKVQGTQIDKSTTNQITKSYVFYVDDVNGNPTTTIVDNATNNINHVYAYGIPSVQSFGFVLKWTTSNNGHYFLPTNGRISRIQNERTTVITSSNLTQEYTTTAIPKGNTYDHLYNAVLSFRTRYSTNSISNVFRVYSYHCLRTTNVQENVVSENGVFFCDYASYGGNGQIALLNSFGRDNVYQYDTTNSYLPVSYDPVANSPSLRDNQLIYYDARFVNPQYSNESLGGSAYRDFLVYDDTTPIQVNYNGIRNTGNAGVKWIVKRFTGVLSDGMTQQKRLRITDNLGTHSEYSRYTNRLFFLQFYSGSIQESDRVSGWLSPNQRFDDQDSNFKQDRGVRNDGQPTQFYLYAESGKSFDVYVRIGLTNDNQTQTFISGLSLVNA